MNTPWPCLLLLLSFCATPYAETDPRHAKISRDSELAGVNDRVTVTSSETLIDIAARYKLGYNLIRSANPAIDPWLPEDNSLALLPFQTILPPAPRSGIVINTTEMRLYSYQAGARGEPVSVYVYPISVGRGEWATPLIRTVITGRIENPVWYPPESIRREHAARGEELPMQVPPGPDNPLGPYMLTMDIPGYFIHGTNRSFGIGMQVTHGCIRMYPEDIEQLLQHTPNNTAVTIISQAAKAGWKDKVLYLEVHPLLESGDTPLIDDKTGFISTLVAASEGHPNTVFDWDKIDRVIDEAKGIPVPVGYEPSASISTAESQ